MVGKPFSNSGYGQGLLVHGRSDSINNAVPFSGGLPHVLDIKMIKSGARKSHLVTLAMEHHWHGMIGIC